MKKTPLFEKHSELGGKIIEFGGWMMPVQYKTGILDEHEHVRNAAGLFDVSHMGEITVKGDGALAFIQNLVTNDVSKAKPYKCVYSPMCYPDGGVVDDLLIYKYSDTDFLAVVNAANIEKDFEWMKQNLTADTEIQNVSESFAQLAVQGPCAEKIVAALADKDVSGIKFYTFVDDIKICGVKSIVSRTGYTGEDGFEIYCPAESAVTLWDKILETGKPYGIVPVGLGARDTLRFEVSLPLYGHELSPEISPLMANLSKFVKLQKDGFIGQEALKAQAESGLKRTLAGIELVDRGVARNGYPVQAGGKDIGYVTTGSVAPSLKKNLAMAILDVEYAAEDKEVDIIVRGKPVKAKVVPMPFYTKNYKK